MTRASRVLTGEKPAKLRLGEVMSVHEKIRMKSAWKIDKFKELPGDVIAKALQAGASIEDIRKKYPEAFIATEVVQDNVGLNEGLQELIDLICGLSSPTKWDNGNARLGVGDGVTAADPSQTGLQGTNKTFKAMDTSYPQRSAQTAEWRSTYGSGDANYTWNEYTVVNAADDTGKNLNRKVENKGTKSSGETWTLSLKITFG